MTDLPTMVEKWFNEAGDEIPPVEALASLSEPHFRLGDTFNVHWYPSPLRVETMFLGHQDHGAPAPVMYLTTVYGLPWTHPNGRTETRSSAQIAHHATIAHLKAGPDPRMFRTALRAALAGLQPVADSLDLDNDVRDAWYTLTAYTRADDD